MFRIKCKNLFPILGIAGMLVSCEGNAGNEETGAKVSIQQKASSNGLDGDWEIVKAEGMLGSTNLGTRYIFDGNSLTLKGGRISTPGTYAIAGDTLKFAMKEYNSEMLYLHKFEHKQLVLRVLGSDQVFYLDRR